MRTTTASMLIMHLWYAPISSLRWYWLTLAQTDGLHPYIDWAIKHGFGVMDINIPEHISHPSDTDPYTDRSNETLAAKQIKDLLCYLWDNYFELNPDASLTLLGVGDAYFGIKQLLVSRRKLSCPFGLSSY